MRTKFLILIGVLAATALITRMVGYDLYATATSGVSVVKKIPAQIGLWQGTDHALSEWVYELLQTRAIVHRNYDSAHSQEDVFLSIVYYDKTKVDFHAPESCLGGLGIKTQREPHQVTVHTGDGAVAIKLYQLIQTHEGRQDLVYYFYKTGEFVGRSYLGLRMNLVFNKLAGSRPSGSLIRISTPITPSGDYQAARSRLQGFLQDLYPYVMSEL